MENLYAHINENKDNYLEELKKFCSQPSVAAENRGMDEMVELVEQKLISIGAEVKKVKVDDSYNYLLAEIKAKNPSKAKTIVIYNHYDVQPETPVDLWDTPPFEPTIKDGQFFARGVADNKGNLLFRLQLIEAWKKVNGDLPVNIKWVIEGEEEIGSPNIPKLAKEYGDFWKDSDICIWETGGVDSDGAPNVTLGWKGCLYIELLSQFNERDLHSQQAAIVDSPVWKLVQALATFKNLNGEVVIEGFYDDVREPTEAEMKLMKEMEFDPVKFKESQGADKLLADVNKKVAFLKQMYFTPTANIAGIWGGYTEEGGVKTVMPNKATAKMDFRLVADQKADVILQKVRNHLDKHGFEDIEIKTYVQLEYGKSRVENEFIQKSLECLEKEYGHKPVVSITSLGSGPVYAIASQFDIPVTVFGAGHPQSKAHAPNENIFVDDYFKAMRAFALFIDELGRM